MASTSQLSPPLPLPLPLPLQRAKQLEVVKMLVAHCPPVTEFRMFRPDAKYPLGFSVKDGLVCVCVCV